MQTIIVHAVLYIKEQKIHFIKKKKKKKKRTKNSCINYTSLYSGKVIQILLKPWSNILLSQSFSNQYAGTGRVVAEFSYNLMVLGSTQRDILHYTNTLIFFAKNTNTLIDYKACYMCMRETKLTMPTVEWGLYPLMRLLLEFNLFAYQTYVQFP